uniref:C-type lectin domain-containing protein n=1 Tax=Stomoxys calcitrans TaxID=35570 RepID=A0A1I8QA53_STOCA
MKALITWCLLVTLGVHSKPMKKWHNSSDGCPFYMEYEQKFNWFQAWEECLNLNMSLLTPDTFYKQQQVNGILELSFDKNFSYWLAGHDNAVEKRHVWATTGKAFGFTNWAKAQPNWSTNDHCILVHESTNQWHDFPCATKLGFVCEIRQCSMEKPEVLDANHWMNQKKYTINVWNVLANRNPEQ